MVKSRYIGDKLIPPSIGILIMGPYKPLLSAWVSHPLLYGNNWSLDPGTTHGEGYASDIKFPMVWGSCRWTHLRPHQNSKFGMGLGSNYPWCSCDMLWSWDVSLMIWWWMICVFNGFWFFDDGLTSLPKVFCLNMTMPFDFTYNFGILVLVCFSTGAICLSVSLWSFKTSICSLFSMDKPWKQKKLAHINTF